MTHPSDDFDELVRRAAKDYNPPGDTPRDRMWTEIQAQRRANVATPAAARWTRRTWYIPAAAAAMLIAGIGIGRLYERRASSPTTSVATTPDSSNTVAVRPATPESLSKFATPNIVASRPTVPVESAPSKTTDDNGNRRETRSGQPFSGNSSSMSYRLAVVEHLAGTEAMITSFRAAAKRGEVDAQITAWARNLLTTTRLLQASAAQEDPTMKRLLDDLELVLVQIAQYKSANPHRAEELELIEHSIERRGVIGKLHTNIPARVAPAGT
jgi:hypothetical protein